MISVIIPLYNKEKSIARTLESVLAQTYWAKGRDGERASVESRESSAEVIIVNDGSTDKSAEVVRNWIENVNSHELAVNYHKYPSFRLINKENGGVSSARNVGVEEARGEYVAFLDGDDLWEPNYIDEMMGLINDFPGAAIYGVGSAHKENGAKGECPVKMPKGFRGVVDNVWADGIMMCYTSSSVCIPKDKIELFDENLTHGEDLDLWFRMMLKGEAVFSNKTLAYYVQDSENRAMSKVPAIEKHIVSVIDRYKEAREQNAKFRKAFDTQMIYFLYPYLFDKRYNKEAKRLAGLLDYGQLKRSMKFRMEWPWVYRIVKVLVKGKVKE